MNPKWSGPKDKAPPCGHLRIAVACPACGTKRIAKPLLSVCECNGCGRHYMVDEHGTVHHG